MNEKHPLVLVSCNLYFQGWPHPDLGYIDLLRGLATHRRDPLHSRRMVSPLIYSAITLATADCRAIMVPIPQ